MPSIFTRSHRGGSGTPMVLVHGFTDTWRTWDLVLDRLERRHDVLAPTLPGHAGGPPLPARPTTATLADAVEAAMDEAGFETAHVVGNSLGGYVALQLAARGRARSVVALAPAGGWAAGDGSIARTLHHFEVIQNQLRGAAAQLDAIVATPAGRRRASQFITVNYDHLPAELLAHQLQGVVACEVAPLVALAARDGYPLDAERITCPVRVVWGTEDKILAWPSTAAKYRADDLPHADWVVLDDVGHCIQLDVPLEAAELILGFTAAG